MISSMRWSHDKLSRGRAQTHEWLTFSIFSALTCAFQFLCRSRSTATFYLTLPACFSFLQLQIFGQTIDIEERILVSFSGDYKGVALCCSWIYVRIKNRGEDLVKSWNIYELNKCQFVIKILDKEELTSCGGFFAVNKTCPRRLQVKCSTQCTGTSECVKHDFHVES